MTNPFLSPQPVEHIIDGQSYKFWPVSTKMLFQLRSMAKPIAKAIGTLLSTTQNDYAKETVEVTAPDGGYQQRTTLQAISADLAKARHAQRTEALEALVDGMMNDANAITLALLIMDSMRDNYQRSEVTPAGAQKFLSEVPAPAMVEMLAGVGAANKKLFDPLKAWVTEITATLKGQLAEQQRKPSEETPETTSSGSTSSTPSS